MMVFNFMRRQNDRMGMQQHLHLYFHIFFFLFTSNFVFFGMGSLFLLGGKYARYVKLRDDIVLLADLDVGMAPGYSSPAPRSNNDDHTNAATSTAPATAVNNEHQENNRKTRTLRRKSRGSLGTLLTSRYKARTLKARGSMDSMMDSMLDRNAAVDSRLNSNSNSNSNSNTANNYNNISNENNNDRDNDSSDNAGSSTSNAASNRHAFNSDSVSRSKTINVHVPTAHTQSCLEWGGVSDKVAVLDGDVAGEALFRGPYDTYIDDTAFRRVLSSILPPNPRSEGPGTKGAGGVDQDSYDSAGGASDDIHRWDMESQNKMNPEKWTLGVLQDRGVVVMSTAMPALVGRTDSNTGTHCFDCSIVGLDQNGACISDLKELEAHTYLAQRLCTACPRTLNYTGYSDKWTGLDKELVERLRSVVDSLIPPAKATTTTSTTHTTATTTQQHFRGLPAGGRTMDDD